VTCIQAILSIMLSFQPAESDKDDNYQARWSLYLPVAQAICSVAQTRLEVAWLLAQSRHETHWARCVLEERCKDCKLGQRCDWSFRDGGPTSTGPWQVKRRWCRLAVIAPTRLDRYRAGAKCALGLARLGRARCDSVEGMFAYQKGAGRCRAPWAERRAKTVEQLLERVP
jgi:hypothetical protein